MKEVAAVLRDYFSERYEVDAAYIKSDLQSLSDDLHFLSDKAGFLMLLDILAIDHRARKNIERRENFSVQYVLLNFEHSFRLRIEVFVDEKDVIPSVHRLWKNAQWCEREIWDLFGLNFSHPYDSRLLNGESFAGHPLRKDFVEAKQHDCSTKILQPEFVEGFINSWVEIEPIHPANKGTIALWAKLDGQVVDSYQMDIGLLHRGLEKMSESMNYIQLTPFMERLNYFSPAMNGIAWCQAVEKLFAWTIPDRAQALRMIFNELSRISDHLNTITAVITLNGPPGLISEVGKQREKLTRLIRMVSGTRVFPSFARIGGVAYDLPRGWITECMNTLHSVRDSVERYESILSGTRLWVEKMKACPISSAQAIAWGFTGPCLRSTGINYDLRKNNPSYFYGDIAFEVPLGIRGDNYDRFLVRMEEIRQSINIIIQVLDHLPIGPISLENTLLSSTEKNNRLKNVKPYMQHFAIATEGIKPPVGEIYSSAEVANGELGFTIFSEGENTPYRVKIRPPSFPLLQSFQELGRDHFFADALNLLNSYNAVASEIDR